ncbi:hypothetical protein BD770DRAFT_394508 [Pilaira anomala]|nr:hypothetical protein BD770DRAFT_394508 [Pilaira anomala]
MISALSPELFYIILSNLPLEDKLECRLVSKEWHRIVSSSPQLYETIIIEGEEEFNKLYAFFSKHKKLGEKVRRLSINRGAIKVDMYRSLPVIFPHVEIFHCVEDWNCLPLKRWKAQKSIKNFSHWKDTIVEIREIGSSLATFALLKGNVCHRLKNIDIGMSGEASELERMELIPLLANAPNLTTLKLTDTMILPFQLDEALDSLPNLKVLAFRDVEFVNNQLHDYDIEGSLKRDEDIKPSQLETLIISGGRFTEDAKIWLKYFSKKITNIKNLVWNLVENNRFERFFETHEHFLIQFLTKCHQLEFYRVHAFKLTAKILKAMTDAGVRLKHIDVETTWASKRLEVFLKSEQMDFIETLSTSGSSYKSLAFEYRKTDEPHYLLKEIGKHPNIKNLRIIQSQQEVDSPISNKFPFDVVLNDMKHLQTLKMDFVSLILRYDSDEPVETSLTKIHIIEGYFLASRFCSEADLEEEYNFSLQSNRNEEGQCDSLDYVEKILPNTEIIMEELDMEIDEETFINFIKKREF